MTIRTRQSLSGFIASRPHLSITERGDARLYARVGQERYRQNDDGSTSRDGTEFHHLVLIGKAAERAHELFKKGDRFVADGHVRELPTGSVFIALRIGHDSGATKYSVDRATRAAAPNLSPRRDASAVHHAPPTGSDRSHDRTRS
ncbi:single-stranded DNA-binding protein [Jiangella ureilytica]|uniref:Single-stranded DNA-binding protein n=1 Tax=Jiangella ureilytica TaxID=2530374 RepID=A0A4R4RF46_9ACTN|nr:single-stranded DNA-binding protein [Jiangella ureilytica]